MCDWSVRSAQFTSVCVVNKYSVSGNWKVAQRSHKLFVFCKIAGLLAFEMKQPNMNTQLVEVKSMLVNGEIEPTVPKKVVSILDTRLAIRPFKISPEGLAAFFQSCNRKKKLVAAHQKCLAFTLSEW